MPRRAALLLGSHGALLLLDAALVLAGLHLVLNAHQLASLLQAALLELQTVTGTASAQACTHAEFVLPPLFLVQRHFAALGHLGGLDALLLAQLLSLLGFNVGLCLRAASSLRLQALGHLLVLAMRLRLARGKDRVEVLLGLLRGA